MSTSTTTNTQEQQQQQQQTHIPLSNTPINKADDEKKDSNPPGLLSGIGDPLGKVLQTGLRPIGAPLEKITGPLGNAIGGTTRGALGPLMGNDDERSELLGGNNKDSYEKGPDKIAGQEQTGENPLGLDQTGRWGFEESSEK